MKKEYDVIVVGAGPAGSIAARFAAQQGVTVLVLEKDRDVGYPVRCGEAISIAGVEEFIKPDDKWISAYINAFSFIAPNGTEIDFGVGDAGYVLERRIFDMAVAKTASEAGAEILTRAYVTGLLFDEGRVNGVIYEHRGKTHEVRAKVVIAADGVESRVGRWAGLKTHIDFRDMEAAVQVTVTNIDINQNTLYFYFGSEVAPQGYFWIFPKGGRSANIGLGVGGEVGKKRSALSFLQAFLAKHYPDAAIVTSIAGGVPCSITLDKISAPGIILVGDAARQINPLSGGGIASGMIGGSIGGRIAGEAVLKNNLNHILSYDAAWGKRLGKRHEMFDRLKNGIYNFDDDTFNSIAQTVARVPREERTLGKIFMTALANKPMLLVDVAKAFIV